MADEVGPLLEAAVIVNENCPDCKGTGERAGTVCGRCEGVGRETNEVPLSEFAEMMRAAEQRLIAPPPSVLRQQALGGEA